MVGTTLPSSMILAADDRPIVAVFEIENRGSKLKREVLGNLSTYLATKLDEGGYQVIPQEQIISRLRSQRKGSYKSCYDQSCQIELGRELAAQKSLSSQILQIGSTCQLTATLYDLRKSAAELAATAGGPCTPDQMMKAIDKISIKLSEPIRKMKRESAKAISDFDKVLGEARRIKEKKKRVADAWAAVSQMATDQQIPRSTRGELLQRLLAEFPTDNPHKD
ncbi:MAG: hypothetical protein E3J64_06560, partial [Anaerolineales bacterium]